MMQVKSGLTQWLYFKVLHSLCELGQARLYNNTTKGERPSLFNRRFIDKKKFYDIEQSPQKNPLIFKLIKSLKILQLGIPLILRSTATAFYAVLRLIYTMAKIALSQCVLDNKNIYFKNLVQSDFCLSVTYSLATTVISPRQTSLFHYMDKHWNMLERPSLLGASCLQL